MFCKLSNIVPQEKDLLKYVIYRAEYFSTTGNSFMCKYNMHCTSALPCINSNSLLTTVLRKRQWARRKRGYWPTTYMMLEATIALLSLPRFCSHRPSRSLITVTRNLFSSSSCIAPDMEPIAQQSWNHTQTIFSHIFPYISKKLFHIIVLQCLPLKRIISR